MFHVIFQGFNSKQSCTRNLLSSSICCCFHVKLPSCVLSRKVSWGWLKHIDCNMTRFAVPLAPIFLSQLPYIPHWHVFEIKANLLATSCLRSSNNNNNNHHHHHHHLHIATSQKISPNFDTVKTHLRWPSKHRWISSTSTCPLISPPFWWKMRRWVVMTSHLFGNGSVKQGRTLGEMEKQPVVV